MNEQQLKYVTDLIIEAGLIKANGGNWRELFRRRQYRHIGKMHRAMKRLYEYTDEELEYVLKAVTQEEAQLDERLCD